MNQEKQKEFEELAKPLIAWINQNANPHTRCVITCDSAFVTSDEYAFFTKEFIGE